MSSAYNDFYDAARQPMPELETGCWAHSRRKFFELSELGRAPLTVEAVRQIDAIFAIEREINGRPALQFRTTGQRRVAPRVGPLGPARLSIERALELIAAEDIFWATCPQTRDGFRKQAFSGEAGAFFLFPRSPLRPASIRLPRAAVIGQERGVIRHFSRPRPMAWRSIHPR